MIKTRPFFVNLVCFYLLISGCYLLFVSFGNLKLPETQAAMEQAGLPYTLQVAMLYLNLIVIITCAAYMMQEANWARWVYLGWGFINIDYNLYIQTDRYDSVIPIAIYLVSALILLLPSANKYFSSVIEFTDE